jgi:hypothetical protein
MTTVDSILAACTLLCIRDVIDADETWQDNLEFALHMISKRGGPLAMLKAADTSFTRRYLLENLAVHDVFGMSPRPTHPPSYLGMRLGASALTSYSRRISYEEGELKDRLLHHGQRAGIAG